MSHPSTLTVSLIVCLCQMNWELDETYEAPGVPINNSKLATLIGLPQVAPLKLKVVPIFLLSFYLCQINLDLYEILNLSS